MTTVELAAIFNRVAGTCSCAADKFKRVGHYSKSLKAYPDLIEDLIRQLRGHKEEIQTFMTTNPPPKESRPLHKRIKAKAKSFVKSKAPVESTDVAIAYRYHSGKGFAGSAYGTEWRAARGGCVITSDKTLLASHIVNQDASRHKFPDMEGNFVPQAVALGDKLEVATPDGLKEVVVNGSILSWGRSSQRTIWGVVPSFYNSESLVSGAPIFRDGKLVSVVTRSDGDGNYAVSGVGCPSGHTRVTDFRVVRASPGQSVYGGIVADYNVIKAEALREKNVLTDTILGAQIVLFPDGRLDYTEWGDDNCELAHIRTMTTTMHLIA